MSAKAVLRVVSHRLVSRVACALPQSSTPSVFYRLGFPVMFACMGAITALMLLNISQLALSVINSSITALSWCGPANTVHVCTGGGALGGRTRRGAECAHVLTCRCGLV